MYAGYPTSALVESGHVKVALGVDAIKLLFKHDINTFALDMFIAPEETMKLIGMIAKAGEPTIGDLVRQVPKEGQAALWRTLAWLIKLGVLTYTAA